MRTRIAAAIATTAALAFSALNTSARTLVYFGTFSLQPGQGIYVAQLDPATGTLTTPELAAEAPRPGFIAIHPDGKHLYAVGTSESRNNEQPGAVRAYAIDRTTGKLSLLNTVESGGVNPCYVRLDREGRHAIVAHYASGGVAAFAVERGGRLGKRTAFVQHQGSSVHPQRQAGPHAHSVTLDPAGRIAVVADLGMDKLMLYRLGSEDGSLAPNDPPFVAAAPGAGPRHFAFRADAAFAYAVNELANTVTAYRYEAARGALTPLQSITTLSKDFSGVSTAAEVVVHPNGKFLYASNRGHDSIAAFRVDGGAGTLAAIETTSTRGKTPRNFAIDPSGRWLIAANQDSGNVAVFAIDGESGRLRAVGDVVPVVLPVCVRFLDVD